MKQEGSISTIRCKSSKHDSDRGTYNNSSVRTCNEQYNAGTFRPSKNISAAFSLLDVGFNGASVRRTWVTV